MLITMPEVRLLGRIRTRVYISPENLLHKEDIKNLMIEDFLHEARIYEHHEAWRQFDREGFNLEEEELPDRAELLIELNWMPQSKHVIIQGEDKYRVHQGAPWYPIFTASINLAHLRADETPREHAYLDINKVKNDCKGWDTVQHAWIYGPEN